MEAILLGVALGAGAVLAVRHGRKGLRTALGWTARQAGWVLGQATQTVDGAKRAVREQFQRGREENLAKLTEIPPPSVPPRANGVANGPSASEHPADR